MTLRVGKIIQDNFVLVYQRELGVSMISLICNLYPLLVETLDNHYRFLTPTVACVGDRNIYMFRLIHYH